MTYSDILYDSAERACYEAIHGGNFTHAILTSGVIIEIYGNGTFARI